MAEVGYSLSEYERLQLVLQYIIMDPLYGEYSAQLLLPDFYTTRHTIPPPPQGSPGREEYDATVKAQKADYYQLLYETVSLQHLCDAMTRGFLEFGLGIEDLERFSSLENAFDRAGPSCPQFDPESPHFAFSDFQN